MGLFNSLLNSAMRRAVNDVVDKAVDSAFNSASNTNSVSNGSAPAQQQYQIIKPTIVGENTRKQIVYEVNDNWAHLNYQKMPYLFDYHSGAAEIDIAYLCKNYEEEDGDFEVFPIITLGIDEMGPNCVYRRNGSNINTYTVTNSQYIFERVELSYEAKYFCIGYRLYPNPSDRAPSDVRTLMLQIPNNCPTDLRMKAVNAFELFAATLTIDFAPSDY